MYVTDEMIEQMVALYGRPQKAVFRHSVDDKELRRIQSSKKHGRNHDVTLYVFKDDKVAVIAKPFYPPKLYRAPSGGLKPGEDFHEGIYREAMEEIGCRIELTRFLLQTEAWFEYNKQDLFWRSFVFQANYISGDFKFTDHYEIKEARLASLDEFDAFSEIMRQSDIGGLHYRAALHDAIVKLLELPA